MELKEVQPAALAEGKALIASILNAAYKTQKESILKAVNAARSRRTSKLACEMLGGRGSCRAEDNTRFPATATARQEPRPLRIVQVRLVLADAGAPSAGGEALACSASFFR